MEDYKFKHNNIRNNTASSSPVTRVASYVLPVIVFSTILNIPKFFETELVRDCNFRIICIWVEINESFINFANFDVPL